MRLSVRTMNNRLSRAITRMTPRVGSGTNMGYANNEDLECSDGEIPYYRARLGRANRAPICVGIIRVAELLWLFITVIRVTRVL